MPNISFQVTSIYIHILKVGFSNTSMFPILKYQRAFSLAFQVFFEIFFFTQLHKNMGFRLPRIVSAKNLIQRTFSNTNRAAASTHVADVPKGYLAVNVGNESKMKRFVIRVWYLNEPSFQELLSQAEEEFGFDQALQYSAEKMTSLISFLA